MIQGRAHLQLFLQNYILLLLFIFSILILNLLKYVYSFQ